jgi:hypothetical protein
MREKTKRLKLNDTMREEKGRRKWKAQKVEENEE